MIRAQAMAIGADILASPCDGEVEAVFARACAVTLADGRRLTLLAGDRDRGMRMAVIPEPDWKVLRARLDVGQKMRIGPEGGETHSARVCWTRASVWHSPRMPGVVPGDGWQVGLGEASVCLEAAGRAHENNPLWAAAHRRFENLCDALDKGEAVPADVERLIGAGPGLTPSGDDLLCGLMAGLAAGGDSRFEAVRAVVLRNLGRTTATSRDYLEQAGHGWWTAGLYRLFSAIEGGACVQAGQSGEPELCHPGRDAARSDASQIRDRVQEEPHSSRDPVSASQHCMLQRARDDKHIVHPIALRAEAVQLACASLAECGHSSGIDLATGLVAGLRIAAGNIAPAFSLCDAAPSRIPIIF